MKKYYLAPIMVFLALVLVGGAAPASAQKFVLTSPANGEVIRGGQTIDITWRLSLDKAMVDNPWGEMEFYLETGEGVMVRITPQMRLSSTSYTWTVPNINTRTARLVLQAGIEGAGDQFRFAQTGTFSIKASRDVPSIMLNYLPKTKAGSDLDISWTSNLGHGSDYDVMISYDRGAHYFRAGTTSETRFALPISKDFAGSITVQIANTRADGTRVTTLQNREATVVIGDMEDR